MNKDYCGQTAEVVLKEVFGYDNFRFLQKEIISNVLNKKDTLAIMPTGGGKSICYQIPALIFDGLTVVVSPLISLMQDQVESLRSSGINAVFLNSTVEWSEYLQAMNSIRAGETKILYVSPETLVSSLIQDLLSDVRVKLSCITVDEAHCVSEWGHDFRPEFLEIANVRRRFPKAVCLALTATATLNVQKDIIKNLGLNEVETLISTFNRPNIFLTVKEKTDSFKQVLNCIKNHSDESGIIYCFSRKQVDSLTQKLQNLGFSALNYHGGMSDEERKKNQTLFIRDQVQIMVATLAFGMGIDKPNVRFVIHHDLPKSIEQYYQEIGRAGRDGLPCEALLLFSKGDLYKIHHFFTDCANPQNAEKLLQSMVSFCTTTSCRRKYLLSYFREKYEPTDNKIPCCDNCSFPLEEKNLTIPFQKLLSCIIRTNSNFGSSYVIDILRGSKLKKILENHHEELSTFGIGKEFSKKQWQHFVDILISQDFLVRSNEFKILKITAKGLKFLKERKEVFLPFDFSEKEEFNSDEDFKEFKTFVPKKLGSAGSNGGLLFPKPEKKKGKFSFSGNQKNLQNTNDFSEEEKEKIDKLKKWRKNKAAEMNVPPYIIFGDKTIYDILEKLPQTNEELLNCNGIGNQKAENFGSEIIEIVKSF